MESGIKNLVRKNILNLKPYSSARSEYKGAASVLLDANENSFGSPLSENFNRYPDPLQTHLKQKLAVLKGVLPSNICIGNGSDELIDHIIRIFCNPGKDEIITCPPTFKMYEVAAAINDIAVKKVLLDPSFNPDVEEILKQVTENTKVIFLCSPNNPTGNNLSAKAIQLILESFKGIVVIDAAYIDLSEQPSFIEQINRHPHLVVLQTMSKAWGLAGLRIGMAFSNTEIIELMTRIKMPYNVNAASQTLALDALANRSQVEKWRDEIIGERNWLSNQLKQFNFIENIYPSDANFILIRVRDAQALYSFLISESIIIRNQSSQPTLNNCLRITVGTPEENKMLIREMKKFQS